MAGHGIKRDSGKSAEDEYLGFSLRRSAGVFVLPIDLEPIRFFFGLPGLYRIYLYNVHLGLSD